MFRGAAQLRTKWKKVVMITLEETVTLKEQLDILGNELIRFLV